MSFPVSHLTEAQKLSADSLVDLYEVTLRNDPIVFRFNGNQTVTWRGNTYEGMACRLSGDNQSADGEEARPLLQIVNPYGIFNDAAMSGKLDLAVVKRRRVLLAHLEGDVDIYMQNMWYIGRIRELVGGQSISFELRSMTEGPNTMVPCRQFIPPEFSLVTF